MTQNPISLLFGRAFIEAWKGGGDAAWAGCIPFLLGGGFH